MTDPGDPEYVDWASELSHEHSFTTRYLDSKTNEIWIGCECGISEQEYQNQLQEQAVPSEPTRQPNPDFEPELTNTAQPHHEPNTPLDPDPLPGSGGHTAMDDLTYRTEQALLGSLLADSRHIPDVDYLLTRDFEDPEHRALYDAITTVHAWDPELTGVAFSDRVADLRGQVTAEKLAELALSCPEPDHAPVYARMVQEAGFRRELADHAALLAETAADREQVPELALHLDSLSEALRVHASRFGPLAEIEYQSSFASDRVGPTQGPRDTETLARQDKILVDLMRHPELMSWDAEWMNSDMFEQGPRRIVFETLEYVTSIGEPVDEIVIAWNVARQAAAYDAQGRHLGKDDHYRAVPQYLIALRSVEAPDYAAIPLGQELLDDHFRARITTAAERIEDVAARTDVAPSRIIGQVNTAVQQISREYEARQEQQYHPPVIQADVTGPEYNR
ncbi:MAG TPA: DnaB-like helicase N-terminal domain-containing protein [Actinospica sp.]|jgi:replicative DNA helicase|nr:DnaB-like helicase N-terminal domain-containing protein [Actinospica sp.]